MALNELLHRHQLAQMRTRWGASAAERAVDRALAAGFASDIRALRARLGAAPVDVLRVT